jgi:hypothetical protein
MIITCGAVQRAVAAEPDPPHWKPALGNWYRWTDKSGVDWDAWDLATAAGSKKVTFLSRRAPTDRVEYFRAILFSDGAEVEPLPYNLGDKGIDVYWHEAIAKEGPFVRLCDASGEYLVDLGRKTTGLMARHKGVTFVSELRPGDNMVSWGMSDYGTRFEVWVAARPAMVVIGPVATEKGKKLGTIIEK